MVRAQQAGLCLHMIQWLSSKDEAYGQWQPVRLNDRYLDYAVGALCVDGAASGAPL